MSEPTKTPGRPGNFELALGAARAAIGSKQDVESLRARLQLKLMHEAGAAAATRATPPAAAVGVGKLALVGAGLLAGALYVGWHRSPAAPQTSPRVVPVAAAPIAQPLPGRGAPEQTPNISAVPDRSQATGELPRSTAHARSAALADKPKQRARSHFEAAPAERASEPKLAAATASPSTEIALITQAQSQLDRRPSAALSALLEHERQFPRGVLAEERDALRVEAERALARLPQARAHAKAFCAQYPNSPQTRRLERWLATQTNADADHKARLE